MGGGGSEPTLVWEKTKLNNNNKGEKMKQKLLKISFECITIDTMIYYTMLYYTKTPLPTDRLKIAAYFYLILSSHFSMEGGGGSDQY